MRFILRFLFLAILALALAFAGLAWWSAQPLDVQREAAEFRIPPGSSLRAAVARINAAGVSLDASLFALLARREGKAAALKAGSYALEPGETPASLLSKLVEGRVSQGEITLVEGWTFRQFRARLDAHPDLLHETAGLSEAVLARRLGLQGNSLEGRLFPDTYRFDKQSSDLELLGRAVGAMRQQLELAWNRRPSGTPLKSPEELLTLASIVEKETGAAADRAMVAAVFLNRLRIGMRLQTDPTVIYGLGEKFDGNLRKRDLQTDTPYNSYTRAGLPPTPIAMPGQAALQAVIQPASTEALYFVARGDGSSHFSRTLDEHNLAVSRYQRGVR